MRISHSSPSHLPLVQSSFWIVHIEKRRETINLVYLHFVFVLIQFLFGEKNKTTVIQFFIRREKVRIPVI